MSALASTLRPVAYREASRAMMALRYGFPVAGIDIKIDPQTGAAVATTRIGSFAPLLSLDDAGAFLRQRLKTVYAGAIGQLLADAPATTADPETLITDDLAIRDDIVRAGELLAVLRAIEYPGDPFELDVPDQRTAELRGALVRSTRDILARKKFTEAIREVVELAAAAQRGSGAVHLGADVLGAIAEQYALAIAP
ncbi:MAG: hypothetical protein JNL66_04155 [Alphaproteobacteria bacterium]|nr:hypothetical protein [Alphaproteobacteria bacterium]